MAQRMDSVRQSRRARSSEADLEAKLEARELRRAEKLRRRSERLQRRREKRRRASAKTLAVLPSLFTIANGLCGFLAVFIASRSELQAEQLPFHWTPLTYASLLIFCGMLFDALDGRIARLTGQTSDLGAQLDSMSDMVSFGVAPAFLAVQLAVGQNLPFISQRMDFFLDRLALVVALIYVACAALRLARFNVEIDLPDERDHLSFKGLPSPGAAGTVASLVLLHQHLLTEYSQKLKLNPALQEPWSIRAAAFGIVAVMLLAAVGMVSRLRYAHVVNLYLRRRARFETVAVIVGLMLFLTVQLQMTLAAVLVGYALSAPLVWAMGRAWRRGSESAAESAESAHPAPVAVSVTGEARAPVEPGT